MTNKLTLLILYWNKKAEKIFNVHTNPGHDARRFAVLHIALHDTMNYYIKKYYSYSTVPKNRAAKGLGQFQSKFYKLITEEDALDAINGAARTVLEWAIEDLMKLNPKYTQVKRLQEIEKNPAWWDKSRIINQTATITGRNLAGLIIEKAKNDQADTILRITNVPVDGSQPGEFRATYYERPVKQLPADFNKLMVQFKNAKPYVLPDPPSDFRNKTEPIQGSETANVLDDVRTRGAEGSIITDVELEKKVKFWSDIKHHIVWNQFTLEFIHIKGIDDPWDVARILALIHTAMFDSAICMFWDIYDPKYYRWRPITALNPNNDETGWQPRYTTPSVPEFPSAFGIFGGAVGEILKKENNTNDTIPELKLSMYYLMPYTLAMNPTTISYTKISEAVKNNAETKVECGWNFPFTAQPSIEQGEIIGSYILANKFQRILPFPDYFDGPNKDYLTH